jgi:hypothetical protein
MPIAESDLPPYDLNELLARPYPERMRLICRTWASQIHATPFIVVIMYWAKYFLIFIGGWAFLCSFSAGYPGFFGSWMFTAESFQRAILWALFYESSGLGCSSGPMNARFNPPIGGFLHFLRPGTSKLPLLPGWPLIGGMRRSWLDVALYAANMGFLMRALLAPEITVELMAPSVVLIPLLGVLDKTLFLAARSEHYWVALVCLTVAADDQLWISACKVIWCFIWFWAATSKLNHHFPSVIMVMMNNGPFFPRALKRQLFVSYPDDLRPSKLATFMAHAGTFTEYMIPVMLLTSESALFTGFALVVMSCFHGFIAANNPSGMPVEWNILMIYGGIFLFGFNPEASVLAIGAAPLLTAFLAFSLVVVPTYGNFFPEHVSFLLSMRYYAGNWAYNVWLFRKGSTGKLAQLTKASGTMREQLESMLTDEEAVATAMMMVPANRFLHFEGRCLLEALPLAVDDLDEYEWMDGEVVAGMVLGWNFGDGHLNETQLLETVQAQCGFEEGELRVVMVESQPLFGKTMSWRVADAKTGQLAEGKTVMSQMRDSPPWPAGPYAEAFTQGAASAPDA